VKNPSKLKKKGREPNRKAPAEFATPAVLSQEQAAFITSCLLPQNSDDLMTPWQTAKMLGTTVGTLNVWRATKRYALAYIKIGASVKYRRSDVQEFINSRRVA